ncbi:MAG: PPOX class F420-dependent oxidoreductase [Chloroflexi bacterium]|nr:PPOX class F420-dependent oxidoreductase [Chloroflexota bacterium]
MKNALKQFENQQYLNIETFRKSGQGVKTPVWFAQDGETLRIWTQSDSGKVKRIRRNANVRVTPSSVSGETLGEWVDANATALEDAQEIKRTITLFKKKYGLMFNAFRLIGKIRRIAYTTIRVDFN